MNAIVTGAASGIGCRVATRLAAGGHSVIAADIDHAALERAASEWRWPTPALSIMQHDVTSAASWSEVMAVARHRFDSLDAMINVAGVLRVESVLQLKPESVALQLDVNTKGVIFGTHAAATVMVPQGHGRIVNIASMAALAPIPGIAVYSASKFAVRGFSLAAAQELEPSGVHVSVVYPDAVDTPMVDYQLDHPGAALTFSGSRILTAEEVARAVVALLNGPPRLELILPWSRGFLARVSTILPQSVRRRLIARLTQAGLKRQKQILSGRTTK